MVDYYKVLNINNDASSTEIKRVYYRLARIYHPDKNVNYEKIKKNFYV
jgi:DnaJ-class molecular chaperone